MYQFPEDIKKAYESSPLPFVYFQNINNRPVPILASDGFCHTVGVDRERVLSWLSTAMTERMDPDDIGVVSKAVDDFMQQHGLFNIVFRFRMDSAGRDPEAGPAAPVYTMVHGLGSWQTMHDGTELAVVAFANHSAAHELTRDKVREYTFSRHDRFYRDPLTGIPNFNYLHEYGNDKIAAIRSEGKTPVLIYTDVNAMRSYNNQYGFQEGDRLLVLSSQTLRLKFPDALVVRVSEDHFLMLTAAESEPELEKDLHEVNDEIRKNAYGNTTGLLYGVCPLTEGITLNEAIDHAKHALKQIENDLNLEVSFYSRDSADAFLQERYIVENLDRALESGWIKVYYQAIVRAETGKTAAFEGLARWIDPERGMLSPGVFIPVLSKYHLLHKLDLYMFETVCREVKDRVDNGLPIMPVSVNFSRQDFDYIDIVAELNRLYDKYELAQYGGKNNFVIEITEQDLASEEGHFMEQLKRLRECNFRIWLDDFCSGYSSMNMFNRFKFDLVKFDMELLRHLDDYDRINRIILKSLVRMLRELKIHTLVEGVESEEQGEFLKEINCELAQGFHYYKPVALDFLLSRKQHGGLRIICESPEERRTLNRKLFDDPSETGRQEL
jgi:diguanylate cyclase (GGDEF)-like protein